MTPLRLGLAQRLVIVVGLGAALIAVGDFITSLGGSYSFGWYSYTPMPSRLPPAPGMSAGPRLAVWLVVIALWAAVSFFILRERLAGPGNAPAAPAAVSGPAPGARQTPAAAPDRPATPDRPAAPDAARESSG